MFHSTQSLIFKMALILLALHVSSCGQNKATSYQVAADGASASAVCSDPLVHTISRPYYPDRDSSPTFPYKYSFRRPLDATSPTIVYVTGGPGQGAIGNRVDFVPANYGLLLLDPRGVGCNQSQGAPFPDDFYRTVLLASDINAVITTEHLDNYLFYGVSYGTMLATVTASLGEKTGVARARAVILTGVLGRAFENRAELYGSYTALWDQLKPTLKPSVLTQLSAPVLPLNYSAEDWGAIASNLLIIGSWPQKVYLPTYYFNLLASSNADDQQNFAQFAASVVTPNPMDEDRMYRIIACHEIAAVAADDKELIVNQGELVPKAGTICDAGGFTADKYDAKNWPITAPIYYFEGDMDPSTPVWQAEYHFAAQTTAPRTYALVKGGGHAAFEMGLGDCAQNLLSAIVAQSDLAAVSSTCGLGVELKSQSVATIH